MEQPDGTKQGDVSGSSGEANSAVPSPAFPLDYCRYFVFIIMQALFSILAWTCLFVPVEFPLSLIGFGFGSPTAKSAFATIFTLWHNVAIAFATGICANAFSREWDARENEPIDIVSKVDATLWQQALYFFWARATKTYRLAFLASIVLLALGATAPSTITIAVNAEVPGDIRLSKIPPIGSSTPITNIRNLPALASESFKERISRVGAILELEKIDDALVGIIPPPNWFIPLPLMDQLDALRVRYSTDLVRFKYSCEWKMPIVDDGGKAIIVDNQKWSVVKPNTFSSDAGNGHVGLANGSTILPLASLDPVGNNGTSAYLFLGGDSQSLPVLSKDNHNLTYIDLTGLPFLHDDRRFAAISTSVWLTAPIATVLLCNPNLEFTAREVVVEPTANLTQEDITVSEIVTDSPGNIPPDSAKIIFAETLLLATSPPNRQSQPLNSTINFNNIASNIFLTPPASGSWENSSAIRPLLLREINRHLDGYTLSGLKTFTTGLLPQEETQEVNVTMYATTSGHLANYGLSFRTTPEYVALHLALTSAVAVSLIITARLNASNNRRPFDLSHIREAGNRPQH